MQSYGSIMCILYKFQTIIGLFGNYFLLYLYSFKLIINQRMKFIDKICINLVFSNILMMLFRGIPWTMQVCNQKLFMTDIECKIIIYVQRVSRGISLCTTCLLSVFQAITITSCGPKWAKLKARVLKSIVPACVFIWVLNLLIDLVVPLYVSAPRSSNNSQLTQNLGYCSVDIYALSTIKIIIWKTLYDAVFVGLMSITSGYMVLILYRHHWQVQHIHHTSFNPSASAEIRATKFILCLMSIFVCFSSLSSIIIVIDNSKVTKLWMINLSSFFSLIYPTMSPFVLMTSDSKNASHCNVFKWTKKSYKHSSKNPE
ncbi:vomeronasal 1 receptor monDomV1R1279 [Monodelphis domestica]|uniref:vomeronasal 1 receptor monDomV1R1279 n=1 Tax=Monodelphis domestica TaxID=13616 RepID=UPI0001C47942|nr:vomeronasal 1 receptor monDomV1R1279 [Monodelphis domestica]